jgi:hypothetical protein
MFKIKSNLDCLKELYKSANEFKEFIDTNEISLNNQKSVISSDFKKLSEDLQLSNNNETIYCFIINGDRNKLNDKIDEISEKVEKYETLKNLFKIFKVYILYFENVDYKRYPDIIQKLEEQNITIENLKETLKDLSAKMDLLMKEKDNCDKFNI